MFYNEKMPPVIANNPLLIATIALGILTVALLVLVIALWLKVKRFLVGGSANIGESLDFVSGNIKDLQAFRAELEAYLAGVEKRLKKSVQSVHTVRFNPFKGTGGGGNQSFATAFLSEDGDGVVISSLYARDHVSIFGKPLKKRSSEHELSDEEREALEGAKMGLG